MDGGRGTLAGKRRRSHAGLSRKGGRREDPTRSRGGGILFPAVADGFGSTLTSGSVLALRGKALKETITNEPEEALLGVL